MVSFGATVNFIVLSLLTLAPTAIQAAPVISAGLAQLMHIASINAATQAANQAAAQQMANQQRAADERNRQIKAAADKAKDFI